MRILLLILICSLQLSTVPAGIPQQQKKSAGMAISGAQTNIMAAADQLSKAYARKDYATIADLTYPALVNAIGGKGPMIAQLTKAMQDMESQGVHIISITFGTPSKMYNAGAQLHCLVPQTLVSTTTGGKYISKTSLLGISNDNGKSWTFLDAGQFDKDNVKQLFPDFNPALVLPAKQQPVFVPNKK